MLGGTIQARDSSFVVFDEGTLWFDKNYIVTLDGGKNASWGDIIGAYTAIKGPLKIQNGRVTVQGVKVTP